LLDLSKHESAEENAWGSSGEDARILDKFCRLFSRMKDDERSLLFLMAQKMVRRKVLPNE
jgi:hypothetical protein